MGGGKNRQREAGGLVRKHAVDEAAHEQGRVFLDEAARALALHQRHGAAGVHLNFAVADAQAAVGVRRVNQVVGERREIQRVLAATGQQLKAIGAQLPADEPETVVGRAANEPDHLARQQQVARTIADTNQPVGHDFETEAVLHGAEIQHKGLGRHAGRAGRWRGGEIKLPPVCGELDQPGLGSGRRGPGPACLELVGEVGGHLQAGRLSAEIQRGNQRRFVLQVHRGYHRQFGRQQDARLERLDQGFLARSLPCARLERRAQRIGDGADEPASIEARHSRPADAFQTNCLPPVPASDG